MDKCQVGRITFGNIVKGGSCGYTRDDIELEYAPKGTIKQLSTITALLSEILPLLQAIDSGYSQRQREQMRERVKELLVKVEEVVGKKGGE